MLRNKLFPITSAIILIALVLSACGPAATTSAPTTAPEPTEAQTEPTAEPTAESEQPIVLPQVDPASATGDIITAGSSTVFPLSERMSELFQQEGYSGNLTVDSIGTGAGFERFCKAGETDISNASRAIKKEETEACKAIGREPVEFRIGTDALAVVVSAENSFVDTLTKEQLTKIFSGEFKTWKDVNSAWPADAIQIYSPGTDSGTFDYFVEVILNKEKDKLLNVSGAQFSEDDNVLAQGVEGSPNAIGYFGYAYFAESQGKLKAIPIESVEPSQETVDNGTYPLSRPLFLYSDAKIMAEKPQVAAFIGFYLQHVNDEVLEVGYFPAPSQALDASIGTWVKTVGYEVKPSSVTGDIITAGSSTVFPLSERMSELFQQEGYSGNLTVDSIGTGAGFERFCKAGETDISNASRAIKKEETEACKAIGREPVEFRIGTDALAVVVSAENSFVDTLTKEQLTKIFSGEFKTWKDVNSAWPADAIQVYSPGTDSGTFDYFVEVILNKEKDKLLNVSGAQFSEDDNVLAQGVEGSPNAIGYFGYAYFAESQGKLKAIPIESVEPSQETVDNGTYPLSRPLFLYSDAKIMAEKPQVAAFIGFYLQHVNDEILEVGYFPAPSQALDASIGTWVATLMANGGIALN